MSESFDELLRKSEGELTSRRAAELERELASSAAVRAEQQRLDRLVEALKQRSAELEQVDLREGLWDRPVPPRAPRRWGWGAVGLAAAAALALFFLQPAVLSSEFREKGGSGSPVGFEAFVLSGERAVSLGKTMRPDDALGFAYRNVAPSPYRALMIYAVDATGQTFWFYPAWVDATRPPVSLLIGTSPERIELREAVKHSLAPGPLVLHAVFSTDPLSVLEVEAGKIPTGNTASLEISVQVVP